MFIVNWISLPVMAYEELNRNSVVGDKLSCNAKPEMFKVLTRTGSENVTRNFPVSISIENESSVGDIISEVNTDTAIGELAKMAITPFALISIMPDEFIAKKVVEFDVHMPSKSLIECMLLRLIMNDSIGDTEL